MVCDVLWLHDRNTKVATDIVYQGSPWIDLCFGALSSQAGITLEKTYAFERIKIQNLLITDNKECSYGLLFSPS